MSNTKHRIAKQIPYAEERWRGIIVENNGSTTVIDNPLYTWVQPEAGGQALAVYNDAAPPNAGQRVIVGRDKVDGRTRVMRGVWTLGTTQTVNPNVGIHAPTHMENSTDPVYITTNQVVDCLVYALSGMTIVVNPGWWMVGSQAVQVSYQTIDMTGHIPVAGARWTLIRIDVNGTADTQDGVAAASYLDLTDADVPEVATGYAVLAAVKLYLGQTAISRLYTTPDVIDLRFRGAGSGTSSSATTTQVWVPGVYASSFFDETDESLHILTSDTGLDWTDINVNYSDTVRDPSLLYYGGKWWIAHTHNGAPTDVIPVLSSEDLEIWTSVVELDTSAMGGTGVAWAPEWYVDDTTVHLFITCGAVGSHKIYETHPTNAGWTTWSNLVEVTGTGFPADMIDAFVVKISNLYYLWYKDDGTDCICYATSTALTSGYTEVEDGDWAGFGTGNEGQCLTQIDADTWRIYYNATLTNGVFYSESSDNFVTWTTPASITTLPLSHGTVLQVSNFSAFWSMQDALGYNEGSGGGVGLDIGARVYNNADISIPNSVDTALTFNSERWDTDGLHSTVTNTSRLTCTRAGKYIITGCIEFAANATGSRGAFIMLNGTTEINRANAVVSSASYPTRLIPTCIYNLAVGNYVELYVAQLSGGALNVVYTAQRSPEFSMQLVSSTATLTTTQVTADGNIKASAGTLYDLIVTGVGVTAGDGVVIKDGVAGAEMYRVALQDANQTASVHLTGMVFATAIYADITATSGTVYVTGVYL